MKNIKCAGPRIVQTELAFYLLFYVLLFIMFVFFYFYFFHFLLQKKGEGDRSGEVTQIKEQHKQKELQGLLST